MSSEEQVHHSDQQPKKSVWQEWILPSLLTVIIVKLLGIAGGLAAAAAYYWLKPKLGKWGAIAVSSALGVIAAVGLNATFTNLTSSSNKAVPSAESSEPRANPDHQEQQTPVASLAGNYATCLLEHLPGMQNDAAARAAINLCASENPGGIASVAQGSGRGFLGYKSGAECAMKKAAETHSQIAGNGIYMACRKLYDEPVPNPFDDLIPGNEKQQEFSPLEGSAPAQPMIAEQLLENAPQSRPQQRSTPTRPGNTWADQRERRLQGCVIQPVMTDAEIAACKNR